MKILLELRPALDGHAGIPQEARLLFRGLSTLDGMDVEGLLQSSARLLAPGLPAVARRALPGHRRVDRLSKVVVSLQHNPPRTRAGAWLQALRHAAVPVALLGRAALGRPMPLGRFEPARFEDFVWRSLFARTLPPQDFAAVTSARYRVATVPWSGLHAVGVATRRLGHAFYPRLDTSGIDVMIAETPYPGRVTRGTRMVVRYHDAIPLLMPHTIAERTHHQASHHEALLRNVRDGAWFACVSEATRRDLLSVHPQAAERAVTIHNMVSHHYFPESSPPGRVAEVIRTRRNPRFDDGPGTRGARGEALGDHEGGSAPRYLLMVSTIEPRKNHLALLSAWEALRLDDPGLQLVLVGAIGWESDAIVRRLEPWLRRGGVHLLEDVPAPELRLLYRHAALTVCPSLYEGFDFAGIEAMRCGGVVLASDIPVHREVYGEACGYFEPYCVESLARSVRALLAPSADALRERLVAEGAAISARYLPERILPQWRGFLEGVAATAPVTRRARPVLATGIAKASR